jgi:hypothetical protein
LYLPLGQSTEEYDRWGILFPSVDPSKRKRKRKKSNTPKGANAESLVC